MSEPSTKRQKMASNATVARDVKKKITDLPEDILLRIFKNGVQQTWKPSDESHWSDESDFEETDSDDDGDDKGHGRRSGGIIPRPKVPFKNSPEVLQTFNCAQVCRNWWKLVSCDDIWGQLDLSYLYYELDPTLYGKRFNHLLRNAEVLLVCRKGSSDDNVNKIMRAAESGRTKFVLNFPGTSASTPDNVLVWKAIRPHLREHATKLVIGRSPQGPGIMSFMVGDPWSKLEELHLQNNLSFFLGEECTAKIAANKALEEKKWVPPFPSLKRFYVASHPNNQQTRWASDMAPNLDYFELDTWGYKKDPVPGWDMHRNNGIHLEFLITEKYRTYTTPARTRVYTKPGPKQIGPNPIYLRLESMTTHTPNYGVLVSEFRNGRHFERRLTFDEFEDTLDLTRVELHQSSY